MSPFQVPPLRDLSRSSVMEGNGKGKRPLVESDGGDFGADDKSQSPMAKKPRFPKGKKSRRGGEAAAPSSGGGDDDVDDLEALMDPKLAAKERAKRRDQKREDDLFRGKVDVSSAEVYYEDNASFEENDIPLDPFNLKQEREEGYFDENGNFVEYARENEIKDAWLDNAVVDSRFAEKSIEKAVTGENYEDLSSADIGRIKRSIANVLQPGETIIQALKRLKGNDKQARMPEGTKVMFDQLTEDAMKLMESGEYNVYHEERETFVREAEGYERLAHAREGTSGSADNGSFSIGSGDDIFLNSLGDGKSESAIWDTEPGPSETKTSSLQVLSNDEGDKFDMFGDDDDDNVNLQTSESVANSVAQTTIESTDSIQEAATEVESDFVYDQSSGYYYSSSLGYYYDPASTLYCCATSGKWYSFDEQTGQYVEFENASVPAAEV